MKTNITLIIVLISFSISLNAQKLNQTIFDSKAKRHILIDRCDEKGLNSGKFGEAYKKSYDEYIVNDSIIKEIKITPDLNITMVIGTWCHDCQELVPQFMKVLHALNFDKKKLTIIGISSSKKTLRTSIKGMNIQKVPTVIFYKHKKEIGRIIEYPLFSYEEHISDILSQ